MKQTVVYTAASAQQAHLLKNILEEMGIESHVINDALQGAAGEIPFGWSVAPRVVVAEEDSHKARQVALEFDRRSPDAEEAVGGNDDLRWSKWPTCPECGRRRQAVCPVCETAGNDLPLAEFISPTAPVRPTRAADNTEYSPEIDESILLMCPNCDESFRPRFYRHCENCSHDYGFGVEVGSARHSEINPRVLLVAGGLVGLALVSILYVWSLFN